MGRWGGWIIAAGSVVIWVWLIGVSFLILALAPHAQNDGPLILSPYLLVTGSATVAAAILYTMAYKLRAEDRLTASRLLIVALVGGTAATLLVLPVEGVIDVLAGGTASHPSLVVLATAGAIEEFAKMLFAVLLCLRLPVKNARIGLFVGGAVGLGFSVVENLGYLQQAFALGQEEGQGFAAFALTTLGREVTGPFLHPVFSALLGAAVFAAARSGRFRLTWTVVLTYLGVAVAHGLFDTVQWLGTEPGALGDSAPLLVILLDGVLMLASGLTWLLVARRIHRAAALGDGYRAELNASSAA